MCVFVCPNHSLGKQAEQGAPKGNVGSSANKCEGLDIMSAVNLLFAASAMCMMVGEAIPPLLPHADLIG